LHFGEISPHQAWHASEIMGVAENAETDTDTFHSELAWREFSHSLLYYNPTLPESPLNKKFENFDWAGIDVEKLERWQKGETGYPIVDAGMRELWATGYMHNRVRMVVASFLVKDLRYHWREGENWFWDTLFDADLANNAASWQWIAGCGADAAPYFRIFNPTTQGEKFDPKGDYIKRWAADSYKIKPIVNHSTARAAALEAFQGIR
jgi:deoxyribodipyrimidine photo-lyase